MELSGGEIMPNAVKKNMHRNLECQVRESRQIGSGQTDEMERVNIDILGISKLKWTGMGEFNSDDLYLLLWARIP